MDFLLLSGTSLPTVSESGDFLELLNMEKDEWLTKTSADIKQSWRFLRKGWAVLLPMYLFFGYGFAFLCIKTIGYHYDLRIAWAVEQWVYVVQLCLYALCVIFQYYSLFRYRKTQPEWFPHIKSRSFFVFILIGWAIAHFFAVRYLLMLCRWI